MGLAKASGIALGLAVISQSVAAQGAYKWESNTHACIVEHSSFAPITNAGIGEWTNAPKSFFIKMNSCPEYAAKKGITLGDNPFSVAEDKMSAQLTANECPTSDYGKYFQVIELEGLGPRASYVTTVRTEGRTVMPLLAGGVVQLDTGGYVDYALLSELVAGGDAWFILRAHCTVLDK